MLLLVVFFGIHAYLTHQVATQRMGKYGAISLQTSPPGNLIFKVSNIAIVTPQQMVADLRQSRVVIIGESHDNHNHHAAQLFVIKALHEAGLDLAIGFEMFRTDAQGALDRWVAGDMPEGAFEEVYADHWDPRLWPLYSPIFFFAEEKGIPMVGLNVPRSIVSQVARRGYETLSDSQREELGVVTCDVDQKYQSLIARVMGNKKRGGASFGRFCQAQVVWDTAMAQNALAYLEQNPRKTIALLAGSFHAWKHGIAEQIERRSDVPYRVILPSSDDSYLNYDILLEDADYVWWVE